jgi:dienelactone hydrolase
MHHLARLAVVLAVVAMLPSPGAGQMARIELHPIASTTLTDTQFLNGVTDGPPVTVAGELRIPRPGTDRLPAVVLVHGSGGVGANVDGWAQELTALGFATLVLDSFTGRKIASTSADQAQLGRLAMIVDTYRVLEVLANHPRVDPARIGLMGFSRGGQAVLYASLKRFQRMHGPRSAEYAAYVAFYPACNTTFVDDTEVSDRPIRIFHGTADDYVPVAPCRGYVTRLRTAYRDVQLTEYPGAHHAFDNPLLNPPRTSAQAQTTRGCLLEERPGGSIVNVRTGQPFSYADPCVERGPTVGYDAQAHAEAVKAVKEFLTATLKTR